MTDILHTTLKVPCSGFTIKELISIKPYRSRLYRFDAESYFGHEGFINQFGDVKPVRMEIEIYSDYSCTTFYKL